MKEKIPGDVVFDWFLNFQSCFPVGIRFDVLFRRSNNWSLKDRFDAHHQENVAVTVAHT